MGDVRAFSINTAAVLEPVAQTGHNLGLRALSFSDVPRLPPQRSSRLPFGFPF